MAKAKTVKVMNEFAQQVYDYLKTEPEDFDMMDLEHCVLGEARRIYDHVDPGVYLTTSGTATRLGLYNSDLFFDARNMGKGAAEMAEVMRDEIESNISDDDDYDNGGE